MSKASPDIRILLEKAAKAAGYTLDFQAGEAKLVTDGIPSRAWRPHLDDGDSRRLEVRMSMWVEVSTLESCAQASGFQLCSEYHKGDKEGATRMVVLRAAAAAWQGMP
ncbi:hypothetical protein [Pseudomonas sp.]|jgi:hypothetical protein|uniref:hypothetical protein n=1 Tax=Pseudomonas sp. TaxID=306 RepID=UPI002ED80A52